MYITQAGQRADRGVGINRGATRSWIQWGIVNLAWREKHRAMAGRRNDVYFRLTRSNHVRHQQLRAVAGPADRPHTLGAAVFSSQSGVDPSIFRNPLIDVLRPASARMGGISQLGLTPVW
jgi:hypothetical protein